VNIVWNWWVLFSIGEYCKSIARYHPVLPGIAKVLSGIASNCPFGIKELKKILHKLFF
jgi:hypothetical protein